MCVTHKRDAAATQARVGVDPGLRPRLHQSTRAEERLQERLLLFSSARARGQEKRTFQEHAGKIGHYTNHTCPRGQHLETQTAMISDVTFTFIHLADAFDQSD